MRRIPGTTRSRLLTLIAETVFATRSSDDSGVRLFRRIAAGLELEPQVVDAVLARTAKRGVAPAGTPANPATLWNVTCGFLEGMTAGQGRRKVAVAMGRILRIPQPEIRSLVDRLANVDGASPGESQEALSALEQPEAPFYSREDTERFLSEAQQLAKRVSIGTAGAVERKAAKNLLVRAVELYSLGGSLRSQSLALGTRLASAIAAADELEALESALRGMLACGRPLEAEQALYDTIFTNCLMTLAGLRQWNALPRVVGVAERLAEVEPQSPAGWRSFAWVTNEAARALAGAQMWELVRRLVDRCRTVPEPYDEAISELRAEGLAGLARIARGAAQESEAIEMERRLSNLRSRWPEGWRRED